MVTVPFLQEYPGVELAWPPGATRLLDPAPEVLTIDLAGPHPAAWPPPCSRMSSCCRLPLHLPRGSTWHLLVEGSHCSLQVLPPQKSVKKIKRALKKIIFLLCKKYINVLGTNTFFLLLQTEFIFLVKNYFRIYVEELGINLRTIFCCPLLPSIVWDKSLCLKKSFGMLVLFYLY